MIRLLRLPPRLIIHDVYQSPRSVLQEANALRVVEIWYFGNEPRDAFVVVLIDVALKQAQFWRRSLEKLM